MPKGGSGCAALRTLDEPSQLAIGLVHLLIYEVCCKLGKSGMECLAGHGQPQLVKRLQGAASDQAVLVEGFAHAHMTAFERVGHAEQVELEYLSLNPRP